VGTSKCLGHALNLLNTCTPKNRCFQFELSATVFGLHLALERANFMYDNNNPIDGQFSSTRGNLAPSSKSNPCPVCGRTKDGDCRISHDGKMVLCHQNFEHSKTQQPNLWHFNGSTSDGRCGIYVFKEESESIQPVTRKPRAKKKGLLPVPIPFGAKLLRLPAPGQSPQPEQLAKDAPKRIRRDAVQITYEYSPTQGVVRYQWPDATNPKGYDKTFSQFHIDPDGKKVWTKGDTRWSAYRIGEVVELLKTIPNSEPIIILMPEGELNVDLARSISVAALTLQGSNWSDPETQKMLEALQATGKNVSLAVIRDNDDTGIKKGKGVGLVARHIQFPCIVIDPRILYPDIPEKGDIREILEAIGPDEFLKRLELEIASQAVVTAAIEEKRTPQQESSLDNSSDSKDSIPPAENNALRSDDKLIQDYNKISAFFGNRIRLNKLSKRIEIDGQPISIGRAKIQLATKYGILARSAREDLQDILMELAEQNEYSPIEEYLLSLPQPESAAILDNLAERYFGAALPIYQSFVRKTLISAVARALSPGCKVDTALILQGAQGFLKSAFLKTLAGGIYFDDSLGAVSDKDERLKMHRAWFVEWSELETVFSRRDVSATKAFLSSAVDMLRPPYHRDTQDFPRASIIVGSTNKDEFLSDETGNRRFWVVPVKKKIDVELLTQERDAIWAAAVLAYKSGENWWLTSEEDAFLAQANQGWQATDVWEVAILNYLHDKSTCTTSDLLTKAIGLELAKQSRGEQMRVSNILRRNSWTRVRKQIGTKREWLWEKVGQEVGQDLKPLPIDVLSDTRKEVEQKVGQEVGQNLKPLPARVSDEAALPALPFSSKFLKKQKNSVLDESADSLTNAISENFERFGVGGRAGRAAHIKTSETPTLQGLKSALPPALPHNSPKVGQEVETSETPTVQGLESALPPALPPEVTPEEFAEQIRKAITNFDQALAIQVWDGLKAKAKRKLREEVKSHLTPRESENFKILVMVGFLLDMQVKYVGDTQYAQQYEGMVLEVYGMDEYAQITCRKPDGYLTTRMKPEELEKL
jgi:predicted P-loop ATPase